MRYRRRNCEQATRADGLTYDAAGVHPFITGDRERRLGLPVNAMNDRRETKGLAKGQMGFLSFLVAPTHLALRLRLLT